MFFLLDIFYKKTNGNYPFFKYCPKIFHKHYFNKKTKFCLGYEFNLKEPKTFCEKIRWLALHEKPELKTRLTDKISAKEYINSKLGDGHCAKILGVYNNFDEIDFKTLPNKFFLQGNNGCQMNYFVSSKVKTYLYSENLKKEIKRWLSTNFYYQSLEPQYKNIKPMILAEELFEDYKRNYKKDYNVHCINGEPMFIGVHRQRYYNELYTLDWKLYPCYIGTKVDYDKLPEPQFLKEMIEYSKILSKDFSYVRVDFYAGKSNLYVTELTFLPFAGFIQFNPREYDLKLGELLKLPKDL